MALPIPDETIEMRKDKTAEAALDKTHHRKAREEAL